MSETQIKTTTINFGPQHPAAHGVLRLVLEMDGEVIERADPHIGQLHRGTEKLLEHKTYIQGLPYLDRMDYVNALSLEHGFALAIEKLLDIEIPRRAQCIRVLFLELSRLLKHIFTVGFGSLDIGLMAPSVWGFEHRERIMEFIEAACGARFHANYIRPGGVAVDIPEGLLEKVEAWTYTFEKDFESVKRLSMHNRIFKQRMVDIGIVSKEEAINMGYSGPNLRASGVAWDLRKAQPYEIYDELDFDVVTGSTGDTYDRFLVRVGEIAQSLKIIRQVIKMIPEGPVKVEDHRISPPPRDRIKNSMEELIHHFKYFSEGFHVPAGETYTAVEVPSGEFGVYMVSDGSNKPYRVKLRVTGFAHLQSVVHVAKNHMLADAVGIMGILDIVFGEIDR